MLRGEISLVSHALDAIYDKLDNNVEVMSYEEMIIHIMTILADAALEAA